MKLSDQDIAYLREAAARDGYNPDYALKVFNYESSGRPDVWGGKGGKYFGLFQAGPSERAQFGVDTAHPTAQNQIDAFGKFLHARGYKPGMGLLDMYSTVNAGSPGHYKASDGNGTVASHVAKMLGTGTASGSTPLPPVRPQIGVQTQTPQDLPPPVQDTALTPKPEEDLSMYLKPPSATPSPVTGLLSSLVQPTPEVATNPEGEQMLQQMRDYHNQMHALAVKGLI